MVKRRADRTGDRDGAGPRDGPGPRAAEVTERERQVLDQYLARYAEPEAAYGEQLTHRYRVAVVAPLCAESPAVLDQWETLSVEQSPCAIETADDVASDVPGELPGDVPGADGALGLWIAVVNARENAPDDVLRSNQELLEDWRASSRSVRRLTLPERHPHGRVPAAAELLVRGEGHHVLLIDASSPGHRFPLKQGVGLARRIGCDVAVALVRRGHLTVRYVGSADGDARLPLGYLRTLDREPSATALLFPFEHVTAATSCTGRRASKQRAAGAHVGASGAAGSPHLLGDRAAEGCGGSVNATGNRWSKGEARVLEATRLVELSWRYYVLGLAWAGSPFAYHTVGSCLAPEVVAYAQARGFPRREAAEDFHLLAKLAKLGEVECLREPTVQLTARVSTRVPFGTGPAARRALLGERGAAADPQLEHFTLHDPRVFVALRGLQDALRDLADGGSARGGAAMGGAGTGAGIEGRSDWELPGDVAEALRGRVHHWRRLIEPRLASCPTAVHRRRRVFEAFDALATLQAVHAFRDAGLPPIPWRLALRSSPFLRADTGASVQQALELAREQEAASTPRRGLSSPRVIAPNS